MRRTKIDPSVVDDVVFIGSYNLSRSGEENAENVLEIEDGELADRMAGWIDEVRALGFEERFVRMWEFYLCYCEGGFSERSISAVHLLLARSGNRRAQYLPEPGVYA